MAQVTSARSDKNNGISTAISHVQRIVNVVNGFAASGDNIELFAVAPGHKSRLHRMSVRASATLGASCTLTGQVNVSGSRTAVTAATTAGAASKVDSDSDADVPFDLSGGEVIELAVGGAGITASATVIVDLYLAARP